jgi:hypothetical protein
VSLPPLSNDINSWDQSHGGRFGYLDVQIQDGVVTVDIIAQPQDIIADYPNVSLSRGGFRGLWNSAVSRAARAWDLVRGRTNNYEAGSATGSAGEVTFFNVNGIAGELRFIFDTENPVVPDTQPQPRVTATTRPAETAPAQTDTDDDDDDDDSTARPPDTPAPPIPTPVGPIPTPVGPIPTPGGSIPTQGAPLVTPNG